MSVITEIKTSLDTFGVEQQVCAIVFLSSYSLALGALLEGRGRRIAGAMAGVSAISFIVLTDPWMHAVLLVVLGVGSLGVFIAAVYVIDWVSRRIALHGLAQADVDASSEPVAAQAAVGRERVRIGRTAPVKP